MVIEILFLVCVAGAGCHWSEPESETFDLPIACAVYGIQRIAQLQQEHPKWTVKKYTCRPVQRAA